jgi:5-formyltetrahydrofolate cyclo-ligase
MTRSRPSTQAQTPPRPPAQRFADKSEARIAIWKALVEHKVARFPFPLKGRIPNFDGADRASARLLEHDSLRRARCVKVNPDSPQRYVRKGLLDNGIVVITPTPRLQGGFYCLDPERIPKEHYWDAASMKMGGEWGEALRLDQLPRVDAIVMGCVAVTRGGARLGKGHGYADLEYAILRELGHPAVPVGTTVHELQILEAFPTEVHDVPVSIIATPTELIEIANPPPAPPGIDWSRLTPEALAEMPVLAELKSLLGDSQGVEERPQTRSC